MFIAQLILLSLGAPISTLAAAVTAHQVLYFHSDINFNGTQTAGADVLDSCQAVPAGTKSVNLTIAGFEMAIPCKLFRGDNNDCSTTDVNLVYPVNAPIKNLKGFEPNNYICPSQL
ncbi:hypothetical protein K491DRAFT_676914 [Lophiostoma macrostomum CBS 122681]|uniref:Uncharacterized protein n=1 Tax=Lophiostoma macrostomum CBS 122681 TaxID=1314788 RepID=A0A6A6TD90_9PLEO|nr:hypothetical protein K491DRAFT_676914 [Lophiostoma macrostomum CBS 122681]